jgi:hypothetical protein
MNRGFELRAEAVALAAAIVLGVLLLLNSGVC